MFYKKKEKEKPAMYEKNHKNFFFSKNFFFYITKWRHKNLLSK